MDTTHRLKCWPEYFDAIDRGDKNFDVRRSHFPRDFKIRETVELYKFDPNTGYINDALGQRIKLSRMIKYILLGGKFGIEAGYVVLGF